MAFVESIVNAPMEACKSMLKSISTKLGYSSDKQYINDTSLEKVLKEKTEFRVTKVTVKKWEVIDQIKIHFDDDTEWSYGPDCGDEDPRALIMTEGEYLTRATHEKLYDHESAGASVEFETNKGRVFKFAPSEIDSISLGHDSNKKTVIADEGYEIVCLKIHRGELIGSEQQPVPKDDLNKTHPKSWYVLAYYAEKEDADLDNELLLEGVAPTRPFQRTRNKPNEKEDKKDESNDKVDDNDENKRQFSESGATLGRRKSLRKRLTSEALNINDAVAVLQRASSRDDTLDEQIPLSPLYQRSTSSFHRSISREAKTPTEERKRPNLCRGVSLIEDKEFFPSDAFTSIPEKQEEPALETTKKEADNENKSRPDEEPTKDVVETTTDDNATDVSDDESDSDSDQEILDLDLDYYHFHDQRQTQNAWKKIKDICSKKRGRGAILVDCLRSSVTKKTGNNKSIDHCRDMATQRGYCSSEDEDNYELFEVFYTLYESMAQKAEFLMFISTIFFMSLNLAVGAHKSLLEGQILTAIATDPKSINWRKMNTLEEMFCGIFFTCDGSYLSLCRSLMLYYFTVRMSLSFFNIMNSFLMKYLSDTKTAQMGRDLFVHALYLDKRFFDETKNIHSYMNVQSLHDLLFDTIPNIITSVARYFVVCYYLISMDLNLGLASVFFTTFFNYFIVSYFIKRDIERWKKQVQIDRVHGQISYDVFEMISTVKTFAKERYHQREYDEWFESLIQSMKKGMSWEYFRSFLEDFIDACEYIGMIYYGYIRYTGDSGMTSSDFIGFIILYQQLHGLFCEVRDNLMWVGRGFHDVKRCTTLRETQPKMINGTNKPENIKGEIVFKDVKFKYPSRPKDQVLKGLNLTIKSNCMTAIVGKSGAGKSTIAKLVTRLYDPSSGSITVDGEDLKSFDVEYFRSNLAVVDQSPELFNRPLAENIAYGMVDSDQCTYAELEAAGKLANCDFISKFREGYYTFAGYGGNDLSGGQLQRIAIARAAIRNPKILILDEATSSLDCENEKEVQEALEKLMKGRTVIVIAHRLSTIRNADNIVCMKDGTVVEQGTHDDLMEKKGAYHKLISQQILEDKKKKGDEGGEQKSVDGEEQKSDVEGVDVKNGEKIVEKSVGNKVDNEENVKNVDGEANNVDGIDDSEEKEKAIESAVESAVESAANSVDEKEIADKDTMEVENLGEIVETKQPVTTWGPYSVNENSENNEEKAPGGTTIKGENDSSVETTSGNKEETAEKTGDNSLL